MPSWTRRHTSRPATRQIQTYWVHAVTVQLGSISFTHNSVTTAQQETALSSTELSLVKWPYLCTVHLSPIEQHYMVLLLIRKYLWTNVNLVYYNWTFSLGASAVTVSTVVSAVTGGSGSTATGGHLSEYETSTTHRLDSAARIIVLHS